MEAASRAAADGATWAVAVTTQQGGGQSGVMNAPGIKQAIALAPQTGRTVSRIWQTVVVWCQPRVSWLVPIGSVLAVAAFVLLVVLSRRPSIDAQTTPSASAANGTIHQEDELYRAAQGNLELLKKYMSNCKICSHRDDASAQIGEIDKAKLAQAEESAYRQARGHMEALRSYLRSCSLCAFKQLATTELERLEKDQLAQTEEREYRAARGDLVLLRDYVRRCKACAFLSAARGEMTALEERLKYATFQVCNSTTYRASVAVTGRRNADAPDWSVEGWWDVPPGGCAKMGKYTKGGIYAVARVRGSSVGWRGTETKKCVEFPGPFTRIDTANYNCMANERLESFKWFALRDDYTWRLDEVPAEAEDIFTFQVCNYSSNWAAVAISGIETPGSNLWMVQGWWTVSPGRCQDIGKFARGLFYAMAEGYGNPNLVWKADDLKLCVERPGPFKRVNRGGQVCGADSLRSFKSFHVVSSRQTWTLGQ